MQLPRDRALLVYWLRQYCVPILVAEEEGKEGKGSEMSCLVIRLATTCLNVQCANMSLKDNLSHGDNSLMTMCCL